MRGARKQSNFCHLAVILKRHDTHRWVQVVALKDGLTPGANSKALATTARAFHFRRQALAAARCCAICGQTMGTRVAFVGGPLCIQNHLFTDAGMHRDCAVYALRVCPFIAALVVGYRKSHDPSTTQAMEHVSTDRPERFGLAICKTYQPALLNSQTYVLIAGEYESLQWWVHGSPVEQ